MESEQIVLCSFVDASSKDKPTGLVSMYLLRNGQVVTPVFRDVVAERNCMCGLSSGIINSASHFLSFSPSYSTFQICSFLKEKPVAKFFGHEKLTCVASHNDIVVAGTSLGSVFVWQLSTGSILNVLNHVHFQAISKLAISNYYLCSGSLDGTVKVWDLYSVISDPNIVPRYSFASHTMEVTDLCFGISGDDQARLVTCSKDAAVIFYDLFDGSLMAKFTFPSSCNSISLDAMETCLFVGGEDGVIYLVDLDSTSFEIEMNISERGFQNCEKASLLKTLDSSPICSLRLSVDNTILISGNTTGSVRFWDVPSRQLLRQINGNGQVTNIECFLKSAVSVPYKTKQFTPFKRGQQTEAFLLKLNETKNVDYVSGQQEPCPGYNQIDKLKAINSELFKFIENSIENN